MNDRELLEFAAKAAGIALQPGFYLERGVFFAHGGCWNPLTDNGNALRLAVHLDFGVFINKKRGVSWVCNQNGDNTAEVPHDDAVNFDPLAATRRAIVRAAAEIGKRMSDE